MLATIVSTSIGAAAIVSQKSTIQRIPLVHMRRGDFQIGLFFMGVKFAYIAFTFFLMMSAFRPLLCLDTLYAVLPQHPMGVLAVFSFQGTCSARGFCARPAWDNHRIPKSSAFVNTFFRFRHFDERFFHSLPLLYQIGYFLSTISTNLI